MTMPADVKAYNKQLIEQFRANGGPTDGRSILLLTTTGARTGRRHTTPMMFIPRDQLAGTEQESGQLVVIASNAGARNHPDWFHNLTADPRVWVEVAGDSYPALATVPDGAERDQLWAAVVARYSFFGDHQAKVERRIPVVVLARRSEP
jgi:deazaflavin-dependent oxidoreductase (nitroreductase family)